MKVMLVIGTRPEAIKLAPLIQLIKCNSFFKTHVVSTGQHREMMDPILKYFSIQPDCDLDLMKSNQSLTELYIRILEGIRNQISIFKPDVLVVQGDTITSKAAAVVGFFEKVKVAHVEAGLRTGHIHSPWPEEFNRRVTSLAADFHFAPTEKNKSDLIKENIDPKNIFVVGNTVIDALKIVSDQLDQNPDYSNLPQMKKESFKILVTVHRRENLGLPLETICLAIKEILKTKKNIEVIWPLHKNPEVRKIFNKILKENDFKNLHVTEPLDYVPFVQLMKISDIILSDSGGVQEEAPFLGKPVLVLRESTERQESIDSGNCELVGADFQKIVDRTYALLEKSTDYLRMSQVSYPYGDGSASTQILKILKS